MAGSAALSPTASPPAPAGARGWSRECPGWCRPRARRAGPPSPATPGSGTTAWRPSARRNAVRPRQSRASMSAPRSTSRRITSLRPLKAAQCSAVKSPSLAAFTSRPAARRIRMDSSAIGCRAARGVFVQCPQRPQPAAAIRGVVPSFDVVPGRAPAPEQAAQDVGGGAVRAPSVAHPARAGVGRERRHPQRRRPGHVSGARRERVVGAVADEPLLRHVGGGHARVGVGAAGQQGVDQRQPLPEREPAATRARAAVPAVPRLQPRADGAGRGVQRRHAVDRPVRVRAPLEQEVRERAPADDDRVGQGMRPVRPGLVHVRLPRRAAARPSRCRRCGRRAIRGEKRLSVVGDGRRRPARRAHGRRPGDPRQPPTSAPSRAWTPWPRRRRRRGRAAPCTILRGCRCGRPSSAASARSPGPRWGRPPAASSSSTMAALAFSLARASGVTPWSSAAFTSAPAASSSSAASASSQWAAQSSAVVPSARPAFTSGSPAASSARTRAVSRSAIASTRLGAASEAAAPAAALARGAPGPAAPAPAAGRRTRDRPARRFVRTRIGAPPALRSRPGMRTPTPTPRSGPSARARSPPILCSLACLRQRW